MYVTAEIGGQSAMTASSTRPAAVVASAAGCVSKQQNLSIPILITRCETSRARAVKTRAIRVRPLAHDHVVCLEKQLHHQIPGLASIHPRPARRQHPRLRPSTRREDLLPDALHHFPATSWPVLTLTLAVSHSYDICLRLRCPSNHLGRGRGDC